MSTKKPKFINDQDCLGLVERLNRGDEAAAKELYALIRNRYRYLLVRRLGDSNDLEDVAHDVFLAVLKSVRTLRNAKALVGFIDTICRRQCFAKINERASERRVVSLDADYLGVHSINDSYLTTKRCGDNPDQVALLEEKTQILAQEIRKLKPAEREILTRFYLDDQPREQIMAEMKLTDTTFRLNKSRAKTRLEMAVAMRLSGTRKKLQKAIADARAA